MRPLSSAFSATRARNFLPSEMFFDGSIVGLANVNQYAVNVKEYTIVHQIICSMHLRYLSFISGVPIVILMQPLWLVILPSSFTMIPLLLRVFEIAWYFLPASMKIKLASDLKILMPSIFDNLANTLSLSLLTDRIVCLT